MPDTYRRPWVGNKMGEERLLILGESHKWDPADHDDADMTIETIRSVIAGKRLSFFTKAEGAVTGRSANETHPAEFWETVAFANYCQSSVEAGGAPKALMKSGRTTIANVLDEVKPKRMLVVSKAVWDDFSQLDTTAWEAGGLIPCELQKIDSGYLISRATGLRVHACGIDHPARRGFGEGRAWYPCVKEFLDRPLH